MIFLCIENAVSGKVKIQNFPRPLLGDDASLQHPIRTTVSAKCETAKIVYKIFAIFKIERNIFASTYLTFVRFRHFLEFRHFLTDFFQSDQIFWVISPSNFTMKLIWMKIPSPLTYSNHLNLLWGQPNVVSLSYIKPPYPQFHSVCTKNLNILDYA